MIDPQLLQHSLFQENLRWFRDYYVLLGTQSAGLGSSHECHRSQITCLLGIDPANRTSTVIDGRMRSS